MAEMLVDEVTNNAIQEQPPNGGDQEPKNNNGRNADSFRIKLANLPSFLTMPQLKKFIDSHLVGISTKKFKLSRGVAYFTVTSPEDASKAVELLDNFQFRGKQLHSKQVIEEFRPPQKRDEAAILEKTQRTANEISAPLADMPYEQQLQLKFEEATKTVKTLIRELSSANVPTARYIKSEQLLQPIRRSPVLTHYRNKCEFTVGLDADSQPCLGFVSGSMAQRICVIVPVDDSILVTKNMRSICKTFVEFIKQSDLSVFDEFKRTGFWKRLTIRDFAGECMLIFTVHPWQDEQKVNEAKEQILKTFIRFGNISDKPQFNVTSLYWQVHDNASDPIVFQHIGGVPYVYESICGVRFRISPETFFQTNSRGAEVLYTVIGDFLDLPNVDKHFGGEDQPDTSDQPNESQLVVGDPEDPIFLLDICCGAGTIGQCLLRRIERATQVGKFNGTYTCFGVELVEQAVQDARRNAEDNGFSQEKCRYVAGQAESVFPYINIYFNSKAAFERSTFVGVLDPPRAGLPTKVILTCRKLEKLRRLVYVSCEPKLALKNIVDLCRPTSKKFDGTPFKITKITPVDMFPQTRHLEWVILLER